MAGLFNSVTTGDMDPFGISAGATSGANDPYGAISGVTSDPFLSGASQGAAQGAGGYVNSDRFVYNGVDMGPRYNPHDGSEYVYNIYGPNGLQQVSGFTSVGQDQLNDPFGLREKTNALHSTLTWGGSSGGSSGGGGGGGSASGGGAGGTGTGSSSQFPGGAPAGSLNGTGTGSPLQSNPYPNTPPVTYTSGGGQVIGGGITGQQPGGQPGPGTTAPGMQPANAQSGLDMYKNSAGYQLMNAPGAFQASPGYQFAVNEAMRNVQQNAASRGLLDSGAVLRDMTDRAQGMASQEYGNWWNRQSQQFDNYQNRLAGLAGGPTGADQAMQTGQALGAGSMQTGSNLGSLFGNQGNAGFGGMMNTGAAQANAMTQAGQQQAQILSANQATQLAGAIAGQNQNRGGLF